MEKVRSVAMKCQRPGQARKSDALGLTAARPTTTKGAQWIVSDYERGAKLFAWAMAAACALMSFGAVVLGW